MQITDFPSKWKALSGSAISAAIVLAMTSCTPPAPRSSNVAISRDVPDHYAILPPSMERLPRIDYLLDTLASKENDLMRLQNGSTWEMLTPNIALVADRVTLVLKDEGRGIAFINKEEIPVMHREGAYSTSRGFLGEVVAASRDGTILKMNDGSTWSVPKYDRFDSGWWLTPYKVLITADRLFLINLEEGKRIWVSQIN